MDQTAATSHYSPRASLVAVGAKIQQLKIFETITDEVHITQKVIKHKPVEKLYDAFIAILAGAQGLTRGCALTKRCSTPLAAPLAPSKPNSARRYKNSLEIASNCSSCRWREGDVPSCASTPVAARSLMSTGCSTAVINCTAKTARVNGLGLGRRPCRNGFLIRKRLKKGSTGGSCRRIRPITLRRFGASPSVGKRRMGTPATPC